MEFKSYCIKQESIIWVVWDRVLYMKESLHVFGEIWEQLGKCLKSGLGKSEKSHKSSYFKHWNVGTSGSSQGNVTSQGHLVARGGLQRVAGGKQVEGCCLYIWWWTWLCRCSQQSGRRDGGSRVRTPGNHWPFSISLSLSNDNELQMATLLLAFKPFLWISLWANSNSESYREGNSSKHSSGLAIWT